jgi:Rho-binding antiterminator
MQIKSIPYIAIDCNSYDVLLAKATLKTNCKISYNDENGNVAETEGIIVDVYTKAKEEFLQLNNGIIIRLDKLIIVESS